MTAAPAGPGAEELLAALHRSHDRLTAALTPLAEHEVAAPSYADEWSIAQVASHLGSGAEVFGLFLDAGLQQAQSPGVEMFRPIWDRWNAKSAGAQAHEALAEDAAFLARVDALSAEERTHWRLDLFGTEQTLAGLLRLRLAEHALHTWDIVVMGDPAATVPADAADLVIDNLSALVERTGRPCPRPLTVDVHTTSPTRRLRLELTPDGARLTKPPADDPGTGVVLSLPGEAFVRLVYGRLDPDQTSPSLQTTGVDLDGLRRAFPGV